MKDVIIKIKQADAYDLPAGSAANKLVVSLDQGDEEKMLRTTLLQQLQHNGLALNNVMFDLLHFALAIYTVDQIVSRQQNGFQGWSRHLKVHFPVNDIETWLKVKEMLEEYIGFLSGDKWEFVFRQNDDVRAEEPVLLSNPNGYTRVCLLSGGLDSFIASIDLLKEEGQKPVFVSHYKTGTESSTQDKVLAALARKFGQNNFGSHKFYVQPNQKNSSAQKENSSRARSLLFICLGLAVATALGDDIDLVLPENGLISLNIPLTKTRLSSHSTRTTHPFFVDGLNKIILKLTLKSRIYNPYQFKTKGEMMIECRDADFLKGHIPETISCSHPEQSRYLGKRPGLNCGYCVPCIIRQAAEKKFGDITTEYALDDVTQTPPSNKATKGSDYRAFKLALEKFDELSKPHSLALQVIRSGPIPYLEATPLKNYIEMYVRGMQEVKAFISR